MTKQMGCQFCIDYRYLNIAVKKDAVTAMEMLYCLH